MAVNIVHNIDCNIFMKNKPDKYYDLAIVDPPYRDKNQPTRGMRKNGSMVSITGRPSKLYWDKLFKISKNYIIWGANNFQIPSYEGFIIWKKLTITEDFTMSMAEIAALSSDLDTVSKIIEFMPQGKKSDPKIHPNQKPIALYKWILSKYAKIGWKIFDSHVGSGSLRIACHDLGFDFEGCELDEYYFNAQEERFQNHIAQAELFDKKEIQEIIYSENNLFPTT